MNKIINGKEISGIINQELKNKVLNLNKKVCLAMIIVGNHPASEIYVKNKKILCENIGISSKIFKLKEDILEDELLSLIESLNTNKEIHGILVQLPLPKHINSNKIANKINYKKDVDCFNPYNIGLLMEGNPIFKPCTPAGCIEILKRKNITIEGKNCLIIGRSTIVGKPLVSLLLEENATVTIAHSKTKNIELITKNADIIFIAIGQAKFLKKDMIKPNSIIIDIGINRLEDGKICGDCDFDDCYDKVSNITPVPGGIGPMTITMLMKNCITAYKIQNNAF